MRECEECGRLYVKGCDGRCRDCASYFKRLADGFNRMGRSGLSTDKGSYEWPYEDEEDDA